MLFKNIGSLALTAFSIVEAFPLIKRESSENSTSVFGVTANVNSSLIASNFSININATQTASLSSPATTTDASISVGGQGKFGAIFKPKVVIINMFDYEQSSWVENLELSLNITVPMLSPLYPSVHSNGNFSIMSITTGESEINAATSMTALLMSPLFDFSETYFLVSGIAGGSPNLTTIGSVTFPKYAVQVGLAYEIDSREIPSDWAYGYVNFGTDAPDEKPTTIYGTEIFELNENLRNRAMYLASNVTLNNGTAGNVAIRSDYNSSIAAFDAPKIVACDTATSDVYWTGDVLAKAVEDFFDVISNGTAIYCSTQQEDNATLEAIMRAAKFGIADYNRVVVTRGISDFDRPPAGLNATEFFFDTYQGGSKAAVANLYTVGLPLVQDIITNWDSLYEVNHFQPENYIGDYFETLGGKRNFV